MSGFTLIELLVVIAIIGVLASIVLASLNGARKKSRDARRLADIKQIQLALELYFDGQGSKYPTATTGAGTCDATASAYGLEVLATNGYIPQVPRDPLSSTSCYRYATGAAPALMYHLGASLEETTNPAKDGDKDCNSSIAAGTGCPNGPTYPLTNGFVGTDAAGCGAELGRLCYDVTP